MSRATAFENVTAAERIRPKRAGDRPRILFVAHTSQSSGPTNSLLSLLPHIRDRYEVGVLVPDAGVLSDHLTAEGINWFIIPTLRSNTIVRMARLFRRENIDLVYGNNPSRCCRNALLAALLVRKPFIWHFRGMVWDWPWTRGLFVRLATRVVAVSGACADSVKRFCPSSGVSVIHNGVDLSTFALQNERAVSGDDRDPAAPTLVMVAHLIRRKGHEYVVDAMERVVQEHANAQLLVVGSLTRDPAYAAQIKDRIARVGLEQSIQLLGLRDDVPQLLRRASIFVHAAKADPHPRAVIEAMASRLPVVAFGVDGVSETVVHGETGLLVEPDDTDGLASAAVELLNSPDRAHAMGVAGRERAEEHFSARRTASRIAEVIDQAVSRAEPHASRPL